MAGGDGGTNLITSEGFACATIAFVVVLQALTSFVERSLVRHKHAEDMLRMMYKELMILGVVALILFIIESGGFNLSPETKHGIEVIHYTLFVVAVFYAIFVSALVALSLAISRHWRVIEDHDFKSWQANKAEATKLKDNLHDMAWYRRVFMFKSFWQYGRLAEMVNFHEIRWRFVQLNNLPTYFSLVTYLKKAKQHVFLELVSVPDMLWVIALAILEVDLFLRSILTSYDDFTNTAWWFIGISITIVAACVVLYLKMRHVFWTIAHSKVVAIDHDASQRADDWSAIADMNSSVAPFHQADLFWLGRPKLVVHMMQGIVFVAAVNTGMCLQFRDSLPAGSLRWATGLSVGASVVLLFVLLHKVVPLYVLSTNIGELVDENLLAIAKRKCEQKHFAELIQRERYDDPSGSDDDDDSAGGDNAPTEAATTPSEAKPDYESDSLIGEASPMPLAVGEGHLSAVEEVDETGSPTLTSQASGGSSGLDGFALPSPAALPSDGPPRPPPLPPARLRSSAPPHPSPLRHAIDVDQKAAPRRRGSRRRSSAGIRTATSWGRESGNEADADTDDELKVVVAGSDTIDVSVVRRDSSTERLVQAFSEHVVEAAVKDMGGIPAPTPSADDFTKDLTDRIATRLMATMSHGGDGTVAITVGGSPPGPTPTPPASVPPPGATRQTSTSPILNDTSPRLGPKRFDILGGHGGGGGSEGPPAALPPKSTSPEDPKRLLKSPVKAALAGAAGPSALEEVVGSGGWRGRLALILASAGAHNFFLALVFIAFMAVSLEANHTDVSKDVRDVMVVVQIVAVAGQVIEHGLKLAVYRTEFFLRDVSPRIRWWNVVDFVVVLASVTTTALYLGYGRDEDEFPDWPTGVVAFRLVRVVFLVRFFGWEESDEAEDLPEDQRRDLLRQQAEDEAHGYTDTSTHLIFHSSMLAQAVMLEQAGFEAADTPRPSHSEPQHAASGTSITATANRRRSEHRRKRRETLMEWHTDSQRRLSPLDDDHYESSSEIVVGYPGEEVPPEARRRAVSAALRRRKMHDLEGDEDGASQASPSLQTPPVPIPLAKSQSAVSLQHVDALPAPGTLPPREAHSESNLGGGAASMEPPHSRSAGHRGSLSRLHVDDSGGRHTRARSRTMFLLTPKGQ